MCGHMRIGPNLFSIGQTVPVQTNDGPHAGPWKGFARVETIRERWGDSVKPAAIVADSYNERGVEFSTHGQAIHAAVVTRPIFRNEPGDVLLVTRKAQTPAEKSAHHRHPVLIPRR